VKDEFLVKVIPPQGYSVYRFAFTRRHVVALAVVALLSLVGAGAFHVWQVRSALAQVRTLQHLTADQRSKLTSIDAQTDALTSKLRTIERENHAIRRLLGADRVRTPRRVDPAKTSFVRTAPESFEGIQSKLRTLARASAQTDADERRLQRVAMRILNLRRIAENTRFALLAAIPSINPAGNGAGIASGYGYRTDPSPEFHQGVDLEADYGSTVRAAAAGVVASAGWDGGFGNKVDVDHGNGYHTWYAHLSRIDITLGARVAKGQPIALVGATGAATGPHLHYQVMHDGAPIDPRPFLDGVPPRIIASLPQ